MGLRPLGAKGSLTWNGEALVIFCVVLPLLEAMYPPPVRALSLALVLTVIRFDSIASSTTATLGVNSIVIRIYFDPSFDHPFQFFFSRNRLYSSPLSSSCHPSSTTESPRLTAPAKTSLCRSHVVRRDFPEASRTFEQLLVYSEKESSINIRVRQRIFTLTGLEGIHLSRHLCSSPVL